MLFPESGDRSGPQPHFAQVSTLKHEAAHIARALQAQHAAGVPWNEMAVFYTAPFVAEEIAHALDAQQVPFEWLKDAASKSFDPARPCVKMMTPHSSKGLQFRVTVIGGVGFWPWKPETEAEQARLLYVAMTRATHELLLTSSKPSRFSERLKALCA